MLQPQKEFQSQHILYCAPEDPTTVQKSPGNHPVLFLLLIGKLICSVCLFVCWVFLKFYGRSRRAWHFKLRLDCHRKWWERSQKYPSLGKERPSKPRPGFALLSRVLEMCSVEAWERGSVFWAASQEGMGIFGRFMWPGSTVWCSAAVLPTMLLLLREQCFRL